MAVPFVTKYIVGDRLEVIDHPVFSGWEARVTNVYQEFEVYKYRCAIHGSDRKTVVYLQESQLQPIRNGLDKMLDLL